MQSAHSIQADGALYGERISSQSLFDEDEWHFDSNLPGKPYLTMRWQIKLADGALLTDAQHRTWLIGCKQVLLHIIRGSVGLRGRIRARSIMSRGEILRLVIVSMSERGLYRFSDLTDAHIIALRNSIYERKVHKRSGDGTFRTTDKLWSESYRHHAIFLLRTIVLLQELIPDGALLSPQLADELLPKAQAPRRGGLTPRIPDEIFVRLLSSALTWVDEIGPCLLARSAALDAIKSSSPNSSAMVRRYRAFYDADHNPISVTIGDCNYNIGALQRTRLRSWLNHLMSACYVLIAGLTGMRLSEALSLRAGCLRTIPTSDGRNLLLLNGTLYKTSASDSGEAASWIAGWDEPRNPVRLAVGTLEALHSRHGPLDPQLLLFTPIRESRGGRWSGEGRSSHSIAHRINAFAAFCGIRDWRFAAHQFRKTFARFVTLSAPNAVLALQRHFKHVSIAMTERYLPTDTDLMDEIIEQSFETDIAHLEAILKSDRLAGIKGEEILRRNAAFRGDSDAASEARKACIESTIGDPGFRVIRHVYGDCFYEASSARCAGSIVNVGLQTCVGCKNFVVETSHLPFWQEQLSAVEADLVELSQLDLHSDALERQRTTASEIIGRLTDG